MSNQRRLRKDLFLHGVMRICRTLRNRNELRCWKLVSVITKKER